MHILKNTKSFALGAAVYALTLEFLLLGRFVYDTMMKEHAVLELAIPGFFVCFSLGWVVFGLFAKKWSKTGTFAGVMLILWAAFLVAIPFISIDLTLRLAPINKINSHSLYMFYVLAGVGALTGLFAGGFFRGLREFEACGFCKADSRRCTVACGLVAALLVNALTPRVLGYDIAWYGAVLLLIIAGVRIDRETAESVAFKPPASATISAKTSHSKSVPTVRLSLWFMASNYLMLFAVTLLVTQLPELFHLQYGYEDLVLFCVVGLPLVVAMVVMSLFARPLQEGTPQVIVPQTTKVKAIGLLLAILALVIAYFVPSSVVVAILLAVAFGGIALWWFATSVQSAPSLAGPRAWLTGLLAVLVVGLGYFAGNTISEKLGELVRFTSRRFYHIPPKELFLLVALVMLFTLVISQLIHRKKLTRT